MIQAYVNTKGNKAEITLPEGAQIQVRVKTNSRFTQRVRLVSADGAVNQEFTTAGEHNSTAGEARFTATKTSYTATFEYDSGDAFRPSNLNTGGPYEIGAYNLMVIVAENGDDADYNDSILEFSWYPHQG